MSYEYFHSICEFNYVINCFGISCSVRVPLPPASINAIFIQVPLFSLQSSASYDKSIIAPDFLLFNRNSAFSPSFNLYFLHAAALFCFIFYLL